MSETNEPDGPKLSTALKPLDFLTKTDEGNFTVTNSDIGWTVISILSRIVSIMLNINLAYEYYRRDKINYFIWTNCCIFVPAVITSILAIFMYVDDCRASKITTKKKNCMEILIFIVILPFFFRYCQSLSYAISCKIAEKKNDEAMQKKYYELMIREDSDVAFVRIFECFLEAAPQKILQLTIVLSGEDRMTSAQLAAIVTSIISMAWCMAANYRCNRFSQPDKRHVTWLGTITQILWQFLVTMSRVLSIAIIASLFPIWTLVGCSIHTLVMTLWIFLFDRSHFCSNTIFHSFMFSLMLGTVFIFTYILPKQGSTFYRYTIFYTLCGIENVVCVVLYLIYVKNTIIKDSYYLIILCTFSIIPFLIGIFFMIIYYKNFHPNIMSRKQNANADCSTSKSDAQSEGIVKD